MGIVKRCVAYSGTGASMIGVVCGSKFELGRYGHSGM